MLGVLAPYIHGLGQAVICRLDIRIDMLKDGISHRVVTVVDVRRALKTALISKVVCDLKYFKP